MTYPPVLHFQISSITNSLPDIILIAPQKVYLTATQEYFVSFQNISVWRLWNLGPGVNGRELEGESGREQSSNKPTKSKEREEADILIIGWC